MYCKDDYIIYDERERVQLDRVAHLLKDTYWASERDLETIKTSIENSVCFSLYHAEEQVGFTRVVTDFATVAYIADVIIDPAHRDKGLGKWLMDVVLNDPRWKDRFQLLVTDDAHTLYERFGFSTSYRLMGTTK